MLSVQVVGLFVLCAVVHSGSIGRAGRRGYRLADIQNYPEYNQVAVPVPSAGSYNSPAKYQYDYSVSDPHTGDHKAQWETREGDVVRGAYSLAEPDGSTRIVEYTADKIHGFRAVVRKIGFAPHPQGYKELNSVDYYGFH
ncbi:cuticle protein 7 [Pieris rapae]|uniref:cuticle protein 7 n=1 Tax=Pieris rapae TaxID=64459 RepID=UPI001E27EF11|nr:cuticle protein 7 [Pieris rapae]